MPSFNDPQLLREIIMDHYQHPRNKCDCNDESYNHAHMDSDSCVDDFHIYLNEDISRDIFDRGICLPSDIKMTVEEQERIIEVIRRCFD